MSTSFCAHTDSRARKRTSRCILCYNRESSIRKQLIDFRFNEDAIYNEDDHERLTHSRQNTQPRIVFKGGLAHGDSLITSLIRNDTQGALYKNTARRKKERSFEIATDEIFTKVMLKLTTEKTSQLEITKNSLTVTTQSKQTH